MTPFRAQWLRRRWRSRSRAGCVAGARLGGARRERPGGARGARPRLRVPRRPAGAVRRRPRRLAGRAGRDPRAERRGQDHARAAPERHPAPTAGGTVQGRRVPVAKAEPGRDPPAGRPGVPGPGRPAVHADGARGRRVRTRQPRPARRRARRAGGRRRWPRWAWPASRTGRRTTSASGSADGSRSPPCSRCTRSARAGRAVVATSTRPPAGSSPTCCSRSTSRSLMVTHDLPYALQLCPRSVVLSTGVVVADGPTARPAVPTSDLMAAHRLELPFGFDPRSTAVPSPEPGARAAGWIGSLP